MLSNHRHPQFSYIRRLVVLPLLAVVVVLFAFRKKEDRTNATISVGSVVRNVVSDVIRVGKKSGPNTIGVFNEARLDRNYTVLIDAGHGGSDKGVIGQDGTNEAALNLQLATKIADLNQNKNIRIILSRSGDVNQDWAAKENLISQKEPDLILSLHVGSSSPLQVLSGMSLFIPGDMHADNYKGSVALANYLTKSLQPFQETMPAIKRRTLKDIKILSNVEVPSVLLSTGYINNADELDKLKNPQYQQQLAVSILQGINNYLSKPAQTSLNLQRMGMDTIILKQSGSESVIKLNYTPEKSDMGKALIVLDGNVISQEIMNLIDPNKIASVDVLKGEAAIISYGERAKNGVVSIKTKNEATTTYHPQYPVSIRAVPHANIRKGYPIQDVDSGRLKKQEDSSSLVINNPDGSSPLVMVDGKKTNLQYLSPYKIKSINVLKNESALKKYGEEGKNGVVEIETKSDGSSQNGEKIFTAVEVPPSFPGGKSAWDKYLQKTLNRELMIDAGAPVGKYVVVVSFKVDQTGKVSLVHANNDPGYGTGAEAERVIRTGPNWIPAKQNGKIVTCMFEQKITWVVTDESVKPTKKNVSLNLSSRSGKKGIDDAKQKEIMQAFQKKLKNAMEGNAKTFFNIDGQSCVVTGKGTSASLLGNLDWVIVNGKKISTEELNQKYNRNEFILAAANDTKKTIHKYGKGLLMVSNKHLSITEVSSLMD